MDVGRTIKGKREDLYGSRRPEVVTGLMIEGSGIRSLRGIERFTSLRTLTLTGMQGVDLRSLEQVTWLSDLAIDKPKPDVDLSPLEHVTFLDVLLLESGSPDGDHAIAQLDFSRLARLDTLALSASSPGVRLPVDLEWVARHKRLRYLYLYGFWPRDRSLDAFYDLTSGVERVFILTTDRDEIARLAHTPAPSNFTVETLYVSNLGEIREVDGRRYIAADLASSRGYETNYDAEDRLQAFLNRTAPDIAAKLQWDTEAGEVVVLSDDEAALQQVSKVLRADNW